MDISDRRKNRRKSSIIQRVKNINQKRIVINDILSIDKEIAVEKIKSIKLINHQQSVIGNISKRARHEERKIAIEIAKVRKQ